MGRECAVAIAACVVALALFAPAAGAAERGGGRFYSGASWSLAPDSYGYYGRLQLDRARVRDWRSGGYLAVVLWAGTNKNQGPYGESVRGPMLMTGITKGWQGSNSLQIFVAQRNTKGEYFEERVGGPPPKLRKDLPFTLQWRPPLGSTRWFVKQGGGDPIADAFNAGGLARSSYAGVESSSRRSKGHVTVTDLSWIVQSGQAPPIPFRGWRASNRGAEFVRHGRGRLKWTNEFIAFRASFG